MSADDWADLIAIIVVMALVAAGLTAFWKVMIG